MALNMLAKDTRICDLVWVKAHAGHDGNEEADHMARKATLLDDPKKIALPKSAVKNIIDQSIYDEWQNRWDNETTCRQTRIFFKIIDKQRSKNILKMSRSNVSKLSQMITGYNNLMYHLSNQEPMLSSLCRLCENGTESFFHLIYECECTERLSLEIMGQEFYEESHTWAVGRILEFSNIPAIDALLFPGF